MLLRCNRSKESHHQRLFLNEKVKKDRKKERQKERKKKKSFYRPKAKEYFKMVFVNDKQ